MPNHVSSAFELEQWHSTLIENLRTLPSVSPTTLSHFEAFLAEHEASLPLALRAVKVWTFLARNLLHPEHAFPLHQKLLQAVYAQWPSSSLGPYPLWVPSAEDIQRHNITDFLSHFQGDNAFEATRTGPSNDWPLDPVHDYPLLHALSVRDPECFFRALLLSTLRISFHCPPSRMLAFDPSSGNPDSARWLPGAQLNIAYCALRGARRARNAGTSCLGRVTGGGSSRSRHPGGGGGGACTSKFQNGVGSSSGNFQQSNSDSGSSSSNSGSKSNNFRGPALPCAAASSPQGSDCADSDALWDADACDPMRPAVLWAEESSPCEVHTVTMGELRALAAQVAQAVRLWLRPGDAVALILPMTPWAVACYLGVILAGCVVVSIAESFASEEVATRLRIAEACMVITQDVLVRGGKHLPLYSRVVVGAGAPTAVVLPCRAWVSPQTAASPTRVPLREGDLTWEAFLHPLGQHTQAIPSPGQNTQPSHPPGQHVQPSHPIGQHTQPGQHTHPRHAPGKHTQPGQSTAPALLPGHTPTPHRSHPILSAQTQPVDPAWPGWLHWAGAADACNILFSSGTTGEPKAIVWSHTTPLRCAVDGWAHQGIQPGDVCCWPTSLGWMMGPWLVFASLLNGCTLALYSGSPLGRDFGQFVSAARVNMLGLVPSIVKAWRHSGCMKGLDWPQLKVISSTGEASSPDDSHWLMALMRYRVPIIEYCGGTELGGAYITGTTLQLCCPSAFSTPAIGTQMVLLTSKEGSEGTLDKSSSIGSDSNSNSTSMPLGSQNNRNSHSQAFSTGRNSDVFVSPHRFGGAARTVVGEVALVAPTLGASQHLLNKDHFQAYYKDMPRVPYPATTASSCPSTHIAAPHNSAPAPSEDPHSSTYVPLRRHGDELQRLPGGYYTARGRIDDTMNLGGIKVASVELERCVLESVEGVVEAAAVGVPSSGGGPEQLVLVLVLSHQQQQQQWQQQQQQQNLQLQEACQAAIRTRLNPLFRVSAVKVRSTLPRNASNKVMRRVLRDEVLGAASAQQHQRRAAPSSKM